MDKLKQYIPVLSVVILFIGMLIGGYFLAKSHPDKVLELLGEQFNKITTGTPLIVYQHDGPYQGAKIEYINKYIRIKEPTLIDNAISHSVSPDLVYEESYDSTENHTYDSVFVKELPDKDLMISVDKYKDNLSIIAINQNKKKIRKYIFTGISNSFTAVSDSGIVLVRTDNFELNGISLYANLYSRFNLDSIKCPNVNVGIETGITAFNRLRIDPGVQYNFLGSKFDLNNFQINLKTSYKIKL